MIREMKVRSWVEKLLLVVLMAELVFMVAVGNDDTSPSQCKEERRLLVNACRKVIFGQRPSPECCQRARVSHVDCICPYVTPKLAALVEVQRTIKQIAGCGRTIPRNFKCGSVTTPP